MLYTLCTYVRNYPLYDTYLLKKILLQCKLEGFQFRMSLLLHELLSNFFLTVCLSAPMTLNFMAHFIFACCVLVIHKKAQQHLPIIDLSSCAADRSSKHYDIFYRSAHLTKKLLLQNECISDMPHIASIISANNNCFHPST